MTNLWKEKQPSLSILTVKPSQNVSETNVHLIKNNLISLNNVKALYSFICTDRDKLTGTAQ